MRVSFVLASAALIALPAASGRVQPGADTLDQALAAARTEAAAADADVNRLEQLAAAARNEAQSLRMRQLAAAQAIAAAESRISAADAEIRLVSVRQQALRRRLAKEQQPISA